MICNNLIFSLLTIINAPIGMFLSLSVMMMQIHFQVAMDTLGKISLGKRSVRVRGRVLRARFETGLVEVRSLDQARNWFGSGRF